MPLELRDYQRDAINALYNYFGREDGNPLVVIPTGGGKSLVLSYFIMDALKSYPDTRIIVLTHVRELIVQNFQEMIGLWSECPAGIYSAGVGRKDIHKQVLFAGIQSIGTKAYQVGRCDLVIVDEAHLIPRRSNAQYKDFLLKLGQINPSMKVIGLTATPFRADSGWLIDGKDRMFDEIAFEVSIKELIDNGYLSPLISRPTTTSLDVSGVAIRNGEFVLRQLEGAVDKDDITAAAVKEMVDMGADRDGWLAFCSGVRHAEHVADAVRGYGITCETIIGEMPKAERDRIIEAFKRKEIRCLTNANVLTTGFNAKHVDMVAMLRPTQSPVLYVQMVGRGTRLYPDKQDCLILDFARNIERHGPVDKVRVKRPGPGGGEAPIKVCEACGHENFAGVRYCVRCGTEFPEPELKIDETATTLAVIGEPAVEWVDVSNVTYHKHEKEGRPPSLRVEYQCGLIFHKEWVCLQHSGFPLQKACAWWAKRDPGNPAPKSVDAALRIIADRGIATPSMIVVRKNGKYTEIVGVQFDETDRNAA